MASVTANGKSAPPLWAAGSPRGTFLKGCTVTKSDPDRLRRRAVELRRRAREAANAELRHQLLEIAETYEDLADTIAGIDAWRSGELAPEGLRLPLPALRREGSGEGGRG